MMENSEFKREERYLVFKLKDLSPGSADFLREWAAARNLPNRQYVVVESDWPEYETVWQMIEARVAGVTQPSPAPEVVDGVLLTDCVEEWGDDYGNVWLFTEDAKRPVVDAADYERIVAALRAENERLNAGWFDASRKALSVALERDALAAQLDNLAGANEALHKQNVALTTQLAELKEQEPLTHTEIHNIAYEISTPDDLGGYHFEPEDLDKFVAEITKPVVQAQSAVPEMIDWLETEISAVDTWYHGSPSYEHDAGWMKDKALDLVKNARNVFAAAPHPVAKEGGSDE